MSSWIFGLSLSPWIKSSVFGCKSFPLLAILEQHIHSKRLLNKNKHSDKRKYHQWNWNITLCHSTFWQNPGETTVSKNFEKQQTQSVTPNRNASWCSKLAKIGVPYIIILMVFTLVCNRSCFFQLLQRKLSSDREWTNFFSNFLFKLFILRSNTVNLNPPPQKKN